MTQAITGTISTPQARTGPMPTGGRWGWYRDHEGNEYRRVSNMIKKVQTDTYNLDMWKKRQVAEGLAIRDDLVLALKAMGRPDVVIGWTQADKRKIDGIVKDAEQAAKQADGAKRGTAYHDLTERLDRGEPIDSVVRNLPAGVAQMVRAYAFLRRENGWQNVEIERTVVCEELEVAGTFDRVDVVPGLSAMIGPGTCQYGHLEGDHAAMGILELPVVVDVKSEASPWLNGLHIGPQLAIYTRSRKMWRPTGGMVKVKFSASGDEVSVPAGEYVPAPCVRQDVAIVVHVTETAATPYFINLGEGWDAAQAAYRQMNREARAKTALGSPGAWFVEVPGIRKPRPVETLVEQALYANHGKPEPTPEQLAAHPPQDVGDTMVRNGQVTHEAYRREDGMVDWRPVAAGEPPVSNPLAVAAVAGVAALGPLDDIDRQAIEVIWAGKTLDDLAKTYDIYVNTIGRTWGGRVAEAGAARRQQVECVQRALHTGGGRCACGWDARFPA